MEQFTDLLAQTSQPTAWNTAYVVASITGIVALATVILKEVLSNRTKRTDESRAADRARFKEFIDTSPDPTYIKNVAESRYRNRYHKDFLKIYDDFAHLWNNSEHEFIDPEINALREAFIHSVKDWMDQIIAYQQPIEAERFCIPFRPDVQSKEDFERLMVKLQKLGANIKTRYDTLVRIAKRKLRA